ncbi:MAG: imidazole glycerol phosphate synthase cyclase subunit [Geobacteraceae bacterium]|nr:imidazole glycerol phosphate synthase cyclase subunit [Geobacteraceae bacterium]
MVFAGGAEKQTPLVQIETECHVILASPGNRLVYSDSAHRRHVNLCTSSGYVFIPITVGGGIRSVADVNDILQSGADKVPINTAAVRRPQLITEVAHRFGSQCMALSIKAIKTGNDRWEAYHDNGREKTEIDAVQWARRGYDLGAGEILLTSVDKEGTGQGFDCDLVRAVSSSVPIPVIASGGMGRTSDLEDVITAGKADAVAITSVLHYGKMTVMDIRSGALNHNLRVRNC